MQVIDLISLKPFDMETISKSIKKTRNAIVVEECMKTGGIGASLSAIINESLFDELDHQVCKRSSSESSKALSTTVALTATAGQDHDSACCCAIVSG